MSVEIRSFQLSDTAAVVALWQATDLTRSWNDPYQDISRKMQVQPELFLVAVDAGTIVGSVMAGYDGHRLAVLPRERPRASRSGHRAAARRGGGGAAARARLPQSPAHGASGNGVAQGFYDALGYEPFEVWATGKRLIVD